MKLSELLPLERILAGINGGARPKRDILTELLSALMESSGLASSGLSFNQLLEALLEREAELSTATGDALAFPHVRVAGLSGHGCHLLAVSPEGVGFDSHDGSPVHFIMLSVVPISNPNAILQARAAFLKYILKGSAKEELLAAQSPTRIWELLDASGIKVGHEIAARDLMRPQWGFLYPDMTLREAAAALRRSRAESLPIVDERGQYSGELSCLDLLSYGMSDAMPKGQFAPLERYFKAESALTVGELKAGMPKAKVEPETPLPTVLEELVRAGRHHVYVVEAGRVLGVIDRSAIVDKVILNS